MRAADNTDKQSIQVRVKYDIVWAVLILWHSLCVCVLAKLKAGDTEREHSNTCVGGGGE